MTGGFDRLARPYRWMEYVTFGRMLERCRYRFLPLLAETGTALVLGDGDGRFAARLLRAAPRCHLRAVDGSAGMLQALEARCAAPDRVTTVQADLRQGLPPAVRSGCFDVVATHFFLDCLSTAEADSLIGRVSPLLRPGGSWVVSEFDVPSGAMRLPSAAIVRLLYAAFRLLTDLRANRLPEYRAAMRKHGLVCRQRLPSLGGLLVAELWTRPLIAVPLAGDAQPVREGALEWDR